MKIFPPKIEIADDEGFTPEKDIFRLKPFGERLTKLLTASDDQLIIALDGSWGTGKSTFVKMWAGELRKAGFPVVYFDAFANDYSEDAFLAIAGEIVGLAQELKKSKEEKFKSFLKKATSAGKVIGRAGLRVAVKAATIGAIDTAEIPGLSDIKGDVAKEASSAADKYIGARLLQHKQEAQTIKSFSKALEELIPLLSNDTERNDKRAKPLIFIIDELDRCKPPFALEIIERIKHIFSTPEMHFVLVSDLEQLEQSVKYSYGPNTNARLYLHKFYNLAFHLPLNGRYEHEEAARRFLEYLSTSMPTHANVVESIQNIAKVKDLSLRSIERIMTYVSLSMISTKGKEVFMPPPILTGLCILKALSPRDFQKAKNGTLTWDDVREAVGFDRWKSDGSSEHFKKWWIFATGGKLGDEDQRAFQNSLFRFNMDSNRIVPLMADLIVDRLDC